MRTVRRAFEATLLTCPQTRRPSRACLAPVRCPDCAQRLTETALRGFSNLGATCFLSAILHSLLAVPQLADYFLRDLHNSQACPINGAVPATAASPCLCCELDSIVSEVRLMPARARLIVQLANGKIARSSFAPHRLLHAIWKKTGSSALAGYSEQDAHELLISRA